MKRRQFITAIGFGALAISSPLSLSSAEQLSPLVDWADLDGNLLISNDCFNGLKIVEGKVTLPDTPGIGVTPC